MAINAVLHPHIRASVRRVLTASADIGGWSCFIVGGFWGLVMVPLAPSGRHTEALAESAEALALAACLWAAVPRLNQWFSFSCREDEAMMVAGVCGTADEGDRE